MRYRESNQLSLQASQTEPRWRAWVVSPRRVSTRTRRSTPPNEVIKATCSLEVATQGATRWRHVHMSLRLQCPSKAHCPQPWGERVGGVSGRPIPGLVPRSQRWKAPRFAGCRKPSRVCGTTRVLVGPNRMHSGLVPMQAVAPATTGALRKNEEGNVVSVRRNITHALIVRTPNKRPYERGHVLHSVRRPVHVNRH